MPCPFCGSSDLRKADNSGDGYGADGFWLVCKSCGAEGPVGPERGVEGAWNDRAALAPTTPVPAEAVAWDVRNAEISYRGIFATEKEARATADQHDEAGYSQAIVMPLYATPGQQTQSDAVAGAVAWEYRNSGGTPFLTHDDPAKWHSHDRAGFNSFRVLVYAAAPPQQATPADAEVTCGRCGGSGDKEYLVGGGPDAYDEIGPCPDCQGTGAVATPSAAASIPAPVAQQGEATPCKSLNALAADLLRPFMRPGQKVIWREAFRWHDDDGVLSNHYDGMEIEQLAEDFGYEWAHCFNFKHAAIVGRAALKEAPGAQT